MTLGDHVAGPVADHVGRPGSRRCGRRRQLDESLSSSLIIREPAGFAISSSRATSDSDSAKFGLEMIPSGRVGARDRGFVDHRPSPDRHRDAAGRAKEDGETNDAAMTESAIEVLDWQWSRSAPKDSMWSIIKKRAASIGRRRPSLGQGAAALERDQEAASELLGIRLRTDLPRRPDPTQPVASLAGEAVEPLDLRL